MECLICYRVEVNFEAEKYKKSAITFCQVFGLPATSEVPFYSSTVCDLCLQRLADIEVMLREIQQIQENVNKVKSEMEKDLLNSQRLSEEESKISDIRVRIINEITSRCATAPLEDPEGIPPHFLVAQPSASPLVQVKMEEGGSQPLQIENSNNFQLGFFPPSPANESPEPHLDFANAKAPMKNAIILLEKLPILVGGSTINVNQEPIKSYTLRNSPLHSSPSNSQIVLNIQEKGGRGRPKRRRKKAKPKPKPTARRMTPNIPRKCKICNKVFNRKAKVLEHMNRAHGGEPSFLCQECGKAFFTKFLLKSHLVTHGIGKDVVTCPLCWKPFKNQAWCDKHVSVVHRKEKAYNCSFCEEKFVYEVQLNTHWRVVHLGETVRIPCKEPGCGKEYTTIWQLNTHVKKMHSDLKFLCSDCGKKYALNVDLQIHIRRVHLNERNNLCELCPARFFMISQLKRHVRTTHLNIHPFKCPFCPKGFHLKQKLDGHLALHSSEKAFECQYCGEVYHADQPLKVHIKRKHSERRGGV